MNTAILVSSSFTIHWALEGVRRNNRRAMQMGLAFAGLMVVGAMAMVMYELFSWIEKRTTAWAHRGSQNG